MRKPELGFAARETSPGNYKFQGVVYTATRTGEPMAKTLDPLASLLDEQETQRLGYDTKRLVEKARNNELVHLVLSGGITLSAGRIYGKTYG
jgi:hypothetical protein